MDAYVCFRSSCHHYDQPSVLVSLRTHFLTSSGFWGHLTPASSTSSPLSAFSCFPRLLSQATWQKRWYASIDINTHLFQAYHNKWSRLLWVNSDRACWIQPFQCCKAYRPRHKSASTLTIRKMKDKVKTLKNPSMLYGKFRWFDNFLKLRVLEAVFSCRN